ncbi:hypothetical protein L0663_15035 [Dyadobacter sp. CY107]|uniref:MATE family efflux transporter n=1 Tax=Dyadobacter fanqingshengii TaxID=2906443 RepID=UPI001EFF06A3|nr:MATE family efflux transporter [Dyadobacter fanqingshengii]MCF2504706.1 hypothetical protein [Dyadobacter fanqingshengii]
MQILKGCFFQASFGLVKLFWVLLTENLKASDKVILNTGILYGRMLITVGISLYSTRLILNALGSTDFGIFNLVAGVIAMLSFLNNAMATSTQRFLSFYQGKNDLSAQRKVFSNSLLLHILIGIVIVGCLEIAGKFLFEDFLNIPATRMESAKTVYHFMSLSVFFTIVTVPFTGSLVANENMLWVAVVSIIEVIFKLLIAISLTAVSTDRLIFYGILMAAVNAMNLFLYAAFCFKKYDQCTIVGIFKPDLSFCKELLSFTGWNLFGAVCGLARTQGLAVIFNLFFGAVVNAAYGIANQVASQLTFFSSTLLRAINPQIMKSEGAGQRERMLRLAMTASKFGFFLVAVVSIPCIFEMNAILNVWLDDVPANTVVFCQLILVGALVNQLTIGVQSAIQATGKIKFYQMITGTIILLNLPITYILLAVGKSAYIGLVSYTVIELAACSSRLYFLKHLAGMSIAEYSKRVFARELIPVSTIITSCYLITTLIDIPNRFILTSAVSGILFIVSLYFTGLEREEKGLLTNLLKKIPKIKKIAVIS